MTLTFIYLFFCQVSSFGVLLHILWKCLVWYHHYPPRKIIRCNFIKKCRKSSKIELFWTISQIPLLRSQNFFHIWNLERKSFSTSYYSTIFDELHFQGHFKVMAYFDLDDLMTLKPSIFWLAIQGIPCIKISAS